MAGRSFLRAREPLVRSALLRPPRSVAVNHGYPTSRFSVAPHAPTLTRGTPRSHHVGFPVTRPGARQGPHDRMAGGRGQGRRAWTLLAARPPPSEDVQFEPMLTSFARPAGMLRQAFGPDRSPQTVRARAASRSRPLPGRFGIRSPRAFRLRLASFPPSAPPNEVPGVRGLLRSRRLATSGPCACWLSRAVRGICASSRRQRSCLLRPPRHPCWRIKCRDVAISTRTKAPEGLESCRREGASYWGAFRECRSGRLPYDPGTSLTKRSGDAVNHECIKCCDRQNEGGTQDVGTYWRGRPLMPWGGRAEIRAR
jgi:hypothetical protein